VGETYDTFVFDVDIPCDDDQHEHISFCVCYRAGPPGQQVVCCFVIVDCEHYLFIVGVLG
jgi:hypothetical protein